MAAACQAARKLSGPSATLTKCLDVLEHEKRSMEGGESKQQALGDCE